MRLKSLAKAIAPPIFYSAAVDCINTWRDLTADPGRSYRRVAYETLNATAAPGEIMLDGQTKLRIHPDSYYEFENALWRDPRSVMEWSEFLTAAKTRKALLDVGSNHGLFSLAFTKLNPLGQALAVEPSPRALACLLFNLRANKVDRIAVADVALSDATGQLTMDYTVGDLSTVGNGCGDFVVDARRGDDLCRAMSFVPDIIKIDVEGHEGPTVLGLMDTIRSYRPILFVELHLPRNGSETHFDSAAKWLLANGYCARIIGSGSSDVLSARGLQNSIFTP